MFLDVYFKLMIFFYKLIKLCREDVSLKLDFKDLFYLKPFKRPAKYSYLAYLLLFVPIVAILNQCGVYGVLVKIELISFPLF